LVRDHWPHSVARLAQDMKQIEEMVGQEIVPKTFEALCQWAYVHHVTKSRDTSRRFLFLYQPANSAAFTPSAGTGTQVTIRFQGFLGQFNVKPLGNWGGIAAQAHRAVQFIELLPGPFVMQIKEQLACVDNIKKLIFRELLSGQDAVEASVISGKNESTLSFQRRVFTRVHNGSSSPPSVLTFMDDPTGAAASIDNQWRITTKINFGQKRSDGGVERCSHHVLCPGDFVDVTAKIDIANV
ncbi:hypothetical protein BV25DRAFT_1786089, partial [Artomyces pyxidatus]